jgi:DNA polymerase V
VKELFKNIDNNMANIQIIQGGFEQKLKLQFAPGIKAGFPSPAEDY